MKWMNTGNNGREETNLSRILLQALHVHLISLTNLEMEPRFRDRLKRSVWLCMWLLASKSGQTVVSATKVSNRHTCYSIMKVERISKLQTCKYKAWKWIRPNLHYWVSPTFKVYHCIFPPPPHHSTSSDPCTMLLDCYPHRIVESNQVINREYFSRDLL